MSRKSWHLDRRLFLQGVGVSVGLPYLECMANDKSAADRPKRFAAVYFPYGVSLPKPGTEFGDWNWFPSGEGRDFKFNKSLAPLEAHRESLTVLSGLSHPNGRRMGGHDTSDVFLTAAYLSGTQLKNTVSIDQLIADKYADETRFRSLTISTDGGVGEASRSSTLSFSKTGQPIPAFNRPRQIFDRFFGANDASLNKQRRQLDNSASMLDLVLEHAKSVRGQLGKSDQRKFDEYLSSVRSIEQRVERSQSWLDIPKPEVNATGLHLDADDQTPKELIQTMYDLMFLAFQTDSTRCATYQVGNMNGATSIAGKFPQLLGMKKNLHGLAHGAGKGEGAAHLGQWDLFMAQNLSYFLDKLKTTEEADGNLLDRTVVFYGSSNRNPHNNRNYPLIVAGGDRLGYKHGQFLKLNEKTPLSNVFVTMLNSLGMEAESFVDSTGEMSELMV